MTNGDDRDGASSSRVRWCAIYMRKAATSPDKGPDSLEAQREACLQYIRSQPGWAALPITYMDVGFSAVDDDRPAFRRLLADVDAGKVDVVLVHRRYRLSLSSSHLAALTERFAKAGTVLVVVAETQNGAPEPGSTTGKSS